MDFKEILEIMMPGSKVTSTGKPILPKYIPICLLKQYLALIFTVSTAYNHEFMIDLLDLH